MSDQAEAYLQEHNIHAILEYLCAQLVYAKPSDPTAFLASELRKLQSQKLEGAVPSAALTLFADADFDVMFQMMDPLGRGALTAKQVHKAITDLGLDPAKARVDPAVQQNYNLDSFKKACQAAQ